MERWNNGRVECGGMECGGMERNLTEIFPVNQNSRSVIINPRNTSNPHLKIFGIRISQLLKDTFPHRQGQRENQKMFMINKIVFPTNSVKKIQDRPNLAEVA
jgi:hypothetical protein